LIRLWVCYPVKIWVWWQHTTLFDSDYVTDVDDVPNILSEFHLMILWLFLVYQGEARYQEFSTNFVTRTARSAFDCCHCHCIGEKHPGAGWQVFCLAFTIRAKLKISWKIRTIHIRRQCPSATSATNWRMPPGGSSFSRWCWARLLSDCGRFSRWSFGTTCGGCSTGWSRKLSDRLGMSTGSTFTQTGAWECRQGLNLWLKLAT
jgi:hypothetical protein